MKNELLWLKIPFLHAREYLEMSLRNSFRVHVYGYCVIRSFVTGRKLRI